MEVKINPQGYVEIDLDTVGQKIFYSGNGSKSFDIRRRKGKVKILIDAQYLARQKAAGFLFNRSGKSILCKGAIVIKTDQRTIVERDR